MKEKPCYIALDFDTVLQEQIVSSAPQVVSSFSPLEEFDAPVYNPSLTLYHCILQKKKKIGMIVTKLSMAANQLSKRKKDPERLRQSNLRDFWREERSEIVVVIKVNQESERKTDKATIELTGSSTSSCSRSCRRSERTVQRALAT